MLLFFFQDAEIYFEQILLNTSKGVELNNTRIKPNEKCPFSITEAGSRINGISIDIYTSFNGKNVISLSTNFSNHLSTITGIFLHKAVKSNNLILLKELIEVGGELNICDREGLTSLYKALDSKFQLGVQILIGCGADVNYSTKSCFLHQKSLRNISDRLPKMLDNLGSRPTSMDRQGNSSNSHKAGLVNYLSNLGTEENIKSIVGRSLLHFAVLDGNFEAVKGLIVNGANVDTFDEYGHTPLYTALLSNQSNIASYLYERTASINMISPQGDTLLHKAVTERRPYLVDTLLQFGANVSITDKKGYTPLFRAIQNDDVNMIFKLMSNKVSINEAHPNTGDYPIHFAILRNSMSCFLTLFEFGGLQQLNRRGLTPFAYAVFLNRSTIIELFLATHVTKYVDVNYPIHYGNYFCTPLHVAVIEWNLMAAKNLIRFGADVNHVDADQKTPIWKAIDQSNSAMVDLLISNGANLMDSSMATEDTLLHLAVYQNCFNCVNALVDAGCEVDTPGRFGMTPLSVAVLVRATEIMELLLTRGADINFQQPDNTTPLTLTVTYGTISDIKTFSRLGENKFSDRINDITDLAVFYRRQDMFIYLTEQFKIEDKRRKIRLMHLAAKRGSVGIMNELIKMGIEIDEIYGRNLYTPLWTALRNYQPRVMEYLINRGADITHEAKTSVRTPAGIIKKSWTLLHEAAIMDAVREANILLDNGFDVDARDAVSWTPLHVAAFSNSFNLVELLIRRGANANHTTPNGYTALDIVRGVISNHHDPIVQFLKSVEKNS